MLARNDDSENLLGDSKIGDVSLTLNMTMRFFGGATLAALIHVFIYTLNSAPQIAQRINLVQSCFYVLFFGETIAIKRERACR